MPPRLYQGGLILLYKHIQENERFLIEFLFIKEHKTITQIAKILNRNKSSIARELKRNSLESYNASIANIKAKERQWHKHSMYLLKYQEFTKEFLKIYEKRYHGVEISHSEIKNKFGKLIKIPSLKQLYNWIRSNRWVIKRKNLLRYFYKKGGKRSIGIFSKFRDKYVLPIWVRPKYIDLRLECGHWEADLIIGKRANGFDNLLTLTERKTRIGYIVRIKSKNPHKINSSLYKLVKENSLLIKSITIDNGIEFEKIGLVGKWLNCKIYVCEPYASYQRGTNENFNGLVRRTFKKGTDFSLITDDEIKNVQNRINNMPRKIFNWKSSNEINFD